VAATIVRSSPSLPGVLSRAQKAAAVLLAVGPDAASKVLAHLAEHEVEQVALEVAQLGQVPAEQLELVLREFHQEALAHQHLIAGGEQHARALLRRLHGQSEADDIVDRLLATVRVTPFSFLRYHEPQEVCQHLRDEHPQTIALVLAHLPNKFASQILAGLEADTQAEVALRVATMDRTSPEVVERVEAALQSRFGPSRRHSPQEHGGVRELASMLNFADRSTERAILGSLEALTPELADEVRALMFVFEDIVTLDDRTLQEVLRQVDLKRLAIAMKGVREDVGGAVLRNLSERARETLTEEIELLGPTRLKDVEAAQTEVVRLIRKVEEAGTIVINRGGEGDLVE
jgi:flagellar motor switch protein FliG